MEHWISDRKSNIADQLLDFEFKVGLHLLQQLVLMINSVRIIAAVLIRQSKQALVNERAYLKALSGIISTK